MSFVHEDPDFQQLVAIVAQGESIPAALVEKDYWVTHTLWALHQTGLEIWFKGGTSLSKGFGLIQRFSEDLDLMIQRGTASGLPEVTNWPIGMSQHQQSLSPNHRGVHAPKHDSLIGSPGYPTACTARLPTELRPQ